MDLEPRDWHEYPELYKYNNSYQWHIIIPIFMLGVIVGACLT